MALAEFYLARPDPNLYNFINTQLLSIIHHDLDASWLAGPRWAGPVSSSFFGYPGTLLIILLSLFSLMSTLQGKLFRLLGESLIEQLKLTNVHDAGPRHRSMPFVR